MDVRPLIHLWLNKPEVYGGCGYSVAEMKSSVFHGDLPNANGRSLKVWGNDYSMLDVWIDIDKRIGKLDTILRFMVTVYVTTMLAEHGGDWERWQHPHMLLKEELAVIACDILQ
jgi:hypothetical protein